MWNEATIQTKSDSQVLGLNKEMNSDDIYSDKKTGEAASFMRVGNQMCGFACIKF